MIQPDINTLQLRNAVVQTIRSFFLDASFLEVDTPIRLPAPAPELYIQAERSGNQFLRTSPELHMKRMLAAGAGSIFQIGPCFRAHEQGVKHRPEFMMLEWYRSQADYTDILTDMQELVSSIHDAVSSFLAKAPPCDPNLPWNICTVSEVYTQLAGWDPIQNFDADRFNLDMVNVIEPSFPQDRYTILMDYPTPVAALSRRKHSNPQMAERWELYAGDLELANAFSELTDATEQRKRFEEALRKKHETGEPVYPLDEAFLSALETGMPPCAGVALGIDRLLMALTGAKDIAQVLSFPNG